MKRLYFIAAIAVCFFAFTLVVFAEDECLPGEACYTVNAEGNIGVRDGQWDGVVFTPSALESNHAQAELNGGQYIDAWGWGDGNTTGEGEALKEQYMVWSYEDGPAVHFGSDYMGAWGNWGINPDCNEAKLNVDTYAWLKTQTDSTQSENAFGMQQYTDANAGGSIAGYGDPIDGAFSVIKTAGSYQEVGDPTCDPVYGWEYNLTQISIQAGQMPSPPATE